jgi:hypothetical protein
MLRWLTLWVAAGCVLAPVAALGAGGTAAPVPGSKCSQGGATVSSGSFLFVCVIRPQLPKQENPLDLVWEQYGPYTSKTAKPGDADPVITASPVSPSQVQSISKFRSCAGHVYYGATDFHGSPEGASNMKHYVYILPSLLTTVNGTQQVIPRTVKLFAPFNGVVLTTFDLQGTGQGITIERQPFDGWYVTIYHTDLSVQTGASVRAGQLIGYAGGLPTFDIALQRFAREWKGAPPFSLGLESIFAHMSPAAAAPWAARGVTTANVIVPRSTRLAQACTCVSNSLPPGPAVPGSSGCYFDPSPADVVPLG